jgi:hypothetical protein
LASPPFLVNWYQLAVLEAMLGIDLEILESLRERTREKKILACELALNSCVMANYIRAVNVDRFFAYLPEYMVKRVSLLTVGTEVRQDTVYQFMERDLPSLGEDDWKSPIHVEVAKEAILALAMAGACKQDSRFWEDINRHICELKEGRGVLEGFVKCFDERPGKEADIHESRAWCVGRLMRREESLTPDVLFGMSVRLLKWLRGSSFRGVLEDMVAEHLSERWREIIMNQRFNLRQPMVNVPAIEDALKGLKKGVNRIARIILVAESAVDSRLSAGLREVVKELAG